MKIAALWHPCSVLPWESARAEAGITKRSPGYCDDAGAEG